MKKTDPVVTDADKYKTIFENDKVRVLDYKDKPQDKTKQHFHPSFVLYALTSFKRLIHLPTGKTIKREFANGDIIWSDAQTHIGENIGKTDTHALIVELKSDKSK